MTELEQSYKEAIEKWISEITKVPLELSNLKDWHIYHEMMQKIYGSQPGLTSNEQSTTVINRMEAFYHFNFYSFLSINPSDILFLSLYELGIISALILTMGIKVNPDIFMKAANSVPIKYHKNIVVLSSFILENVNLTKDSFKFLSEPLTSVKENFFDSSSCPEASFSIPKEERTPLRSINPSEIAIDTPVSQRNVSFMFSPLVSVHNDKIRMLKLQLNEQCRLTESAELSLEVARNQIDIEVKKNQNLLEKLKIKETIIKDLNDEIDHLNSEVSTEEINQKYEKSLNQISALNAKIASLNKHLKNVTGINASLKEKISNFEAEDANRSQMWKQGLKEVQDSLQKMDTSKQEPPSEKSFFSQPATKSTRHIGVQCASNIGPSSPMAGERVSSILENNLIETLQTELEQAKISIDSLRTELNQKEVNQDTLAKKAADLEEKMNENDLRLRGVILSKEEEINSLRQDMIKVRSEESERQTEELRATSHKLDNVKLELNEKKEKIEEMKKQHSIEIKEIKQAMLNDRKSLDSIEYNNMELKDELEKLRSISRKENEDIKRVRDDLSCHMKMIEEMERDQARLKDRYERKIESLESKVLQHLETIEFDKKKYNSTIRDLDTKLVNSNSKINELTKSNQDLTIKLASLEADLKAAKKRINESEKMTESLNQELNEALDVVKNSKKVIMNLENELQSNDYRLKNMEEQNQYLMNKISSSASIHHENEEYKNQIESLKQHQQTLVSKLVKLECDNEELNQHLEIFRQTKRKSDSLRSLPVMETDLTFTRPNFSMQKESLNETVLPNDSFKMNLDEFKQSAERILLRSSERRALPPPPPPMREPEFLVRTQIDDNKRQDDLSSLSNFTDTFPNLQRFREDTDSSCKISRAGTMEIRNTFHSINTNYQESLVGDDQSSLKRRFQQYNSTPDLTDIHNENKKNSSSQQSSQKKGKSNLFNRIKKSKALKFV